MRKAACLCFLAHRKSISASLLTRRRKRHLQQLHRTLYCHADLCHDQNPARRANRRRGSFSACFKSLHRQKVRVLHLSRWNVSSESRCTRRNQKINPVGIIDGLLKGTANVWLIDFRVPAVINVARDWLYLHDS